MARAWCEPEALAALGLAALLPHNLKLRGYRASPNNYYTMADEPIAQS